MYQLIGDEVCDSAELWKEIEKKTSFTILEDMSKRTKRDDAVAFKVAIAVESLKENMPRYIEDAELMDELMCLADEKIRLQLKEIRSQEGVWASYAYTYDEVEHRVLLVIGMMGRDNAARKLPDVMKRLLTQV